MTGKGGVGKTTVAAALALLAARGADTIVCELGGQERLPALFGRPPPRAGTPCALRRGLSSITIDTDRALSEWVARNAGRPAAALVARSQAFGYLVAAAPGARELVTIGKAADLARGGRRVVVDAPASGHGLALLQAPGTYAGMGAPGPVGRQAAALRDTLADPAQTAIVLVCTPEELPVAETLELAAGVERVTGRRADLVVVDRLAPDRFTGADVRRIDAALRREPRPALRAARREARRARAQRAQLATLRAGVALPVVTLPELARGIDGPAGLQVLVSVLERGASPRGSVTRRGAATGQAARRLAAGDRHR